MHWQAKPFGCVFVYLISQHLCSALCDSSYKMMMTKSLKYSLHTHKHITYPHNTILNSLRVNDLDTERKMCVCVYVCTCIPPCLQVFVCIHIFSQCVYLWVYVSIILHTYNSLCFWVSFFYACMCVCVYKCII